MLDRDRGIEEAAAVGKGIRRDVENAHHQRRGRAPAGRASGCAALCSCAGWRDRLGRAMRHGARFARVPGRVSSAADAGTMSAGARRSLGPRTRSIGDLRAAAFLACSIQRADGLLGRHAGGPACASCSPRPWPWRALPGCGTFSSLDGIDADLAQQLGISLPRPLTRSWSAMLAKRSSRFSSIPVCAPAACGLSGSWRPPAAVAVVRMPAALSALRCRRSASSSSMAVIRIRTSSSPRSDSR